MEIIISSVVGAISAIVVAIIHNKAIERKKSQTCDRIINTLNVDNKNIYIIDSKEEERGKQPMHYSKASTEKIIFIIK
jgi:hypothetical protein